jgi:hypothetical protein
MNRIVVQTHVGLKSEQGRSQESIIHLAIGGSFWKRSKEMKSWRLPSLLGCAFGALLGCLVATGKQLQR